MLRLVAILPLMGALTRTAPSPVGQLLVSLVASGQAVALCDQPLPNAVAADLETIEPSRVHARGCAPPPLLPSSLLFLCLLRRHPCSQHATCSTKHSAPWHSSPTLLGQPGGVSELNREQAASQWLGEPLPNAVDAYNETGEPSRAHTRGCAPPPLQPSSMLTGRDTD